MAAPTPLIRSANPGFFWARYTSLGHRDAETVEALRSGRGTPEQIAENDRLMDLAKTQLEQAEINQPFMGKPS